jgi:hypothetical protein
MQHRLTCILKPLNARLQVVELGRYAVVFSYLTILFRLLRLHSLVQEMNEKTRRMRGETTAV